MDSAIETAKPPVPEVIEPVATPPAPAAPVVRAMTGSSFARYSQTIDLLKIADVDYESLNINQIFADGYVTSHLIGPDKIIPEGGIQNDVLHYRVWHEWADEEAGAEIYRMSLLER